MEEVRQDPKACGYGRRERRAVNCPKEDVIEGDDEGGDGRKGERKGVWEVRDRRREVEKKEGGMVGGGEDGRGKEKGEEYTEGRKKRRKGE